MCEAFSKVNGNARLVIWGDANSEYGRDLMTKYSGKNIEFKGRYHNDDLQQVLIHLMFWFVRRFGLKMRRS